MKALILEDNPFNNYYATLELECLGYHVHSADNATEAINLAKQIPFSLILVDANISNQQFFQSTLESIELFRDNCREGTVLLLMIRGNLGTIPPGLLQDGVSGYIQKPVTAEAVSAALLKMGCAPQALKTTTAKPARRNPFAKPSCQTNKLTDRNNRQSDKQIRPITSPRMHKPRVAVDAPRFDKTHPEKRFPDSSLPALPPASCIARHSAATEALRQCESKRVLVIAPPKQGKAITDTLSAFGYLPMAVPSLSQGLAWLNFTRPDLLIVDMAAPDVSTIPAGVWHLLPFHELPVVFIAPQGIDPAETREMAAIGNGLLVRPWHREQLRAVVDMTLAGVHWNRLHNRSLFDAIPEALVLVNLLEDDRLLDANEAACALFGRTISDLLSCTLGQLVQTTAGDTPEKRRSIANLQRSDGSYAGIPVEIEQRLLSLKGRQTAMYLIRDMRDGQSEQGEKSLLTQATEYNPCAVLICDVAGCIRYVNNRFTVLTGYSFAEALDRNISFLNSGYHDNDFFSKIWTKLQSSTRWNGEICNKTKDGDIFWGQTSISGILDSSGNISQYVLTIDDITAKKNEEDKLRFQAMYDPLTEIPNRRLFMERLQWAFACCNSTSSLIVILYLDLDDFKYINDTLGHDYGDKLLHEVGQRLKHCLRAKDTVARFGGDEFVMLLQDLHSIDCAYTVVSKLQQALRDPCLIMGEEILIRGSLGLSCHPGDGDCAEDLIKAADDRMYLCKTLTPNHQKMHPISFTPPDCAVIRQKPPQSS